MLTVLEGPPPVAPPAPTVVALLAALPDRAPWLIFHRGASTETLDGARARPLAAGWARPLADAGVRAGDRVALLLPNGPDFPGAFFGALLLGATPVPLPWPVAAAGAQRDLLAARLRAARPRVLVAAPPLDSGWELPVVTAPTVGAVAARPARPEELAF